LRQRLIDAISAAVTARMVMPGSSSYLVVSLVSGLHWWLPARPVSDNPGNLPGPGHQESSPAGVVLGASFATIATTDVRDLNPQIFVTAVTPMAAAARAIAAS
jgi:hypothetical protein